MTAAVPERVRERITAAAAAAKAKSTASVKSGVSGKAEAAGRDGTAGADGGGGGGNGFQGGEDEATFQGEGGAGRPSQMMMGSHRRSCSVRNHRTPRPPGHAPMRAAGARRRRSLGHFRLQLF